MSASPRKRQISRRLWMSSRNRGQATRSSFELACDKFLDHLTSLVGLRTRFRDPFVNGIFEQAIVALAAGGSVGLGEFFLHHFETFATSTHARANACARHGVLHNFASAEA